MNETTTENACAGPDSESKTARMFRNAVDAVIEACDVQMGVTLEPEGNVRPPDPTRSAYGSSIALTDVDGGSNMVLVGDADSCARLTRAMFDMEDDEEVGEEDMADALGELVNITAGGFKAKCAEAGKKLQLGLPLFLEGGGCIEFFVNGVSGAAQPLVGPDGIRIQMVLIWKGGDTACL